MKSLMHALNLKDDATEAEALSAVGRILDGHREIVAATGQTNLGQALGVVFAWKDSHSKVPVLSQRVAELEKRIQDTEVVGLVDKAIEGQSAHW